MDVRTLRELCDGGFLSHVAACPCDGGGWTLFCVYEGHEEPEWFLKTTRGETRVFRTLDAAHRFLERNMSLRKTALVVPVGDLFACESET